MTWALIRGGCVVFTGSYAAVLDTAEEWEALGRRRHEDGTIVAMRLAPGWSVRPAAMVADLDRAEAA